MSVFFIKWPLHPVRKQTENTPNFGKMVGGGGMSMRKYFCAFCGIAVFVGFMSLVGNPHVVETIIGLCLGAIVWFGLYFKLRKNN